MPEVIDTRSMKDVLSPDESVPEKVIVCAPAAAMLNPNEKVLNWKSAVGTTGLPSGTPSTLTTIGWYVPAGTLNGRRAAWKEMRYEPAFRLTVCENDPAP